MSFYAIPLGGVGHFGGNCMAIGFGASPNIVVVDAGVRHAHHFDGGVDGFIPAWSLIEARDLKIQAYVLTHGHYDHIGAVHTFFERYPAPVYGLPYTLDMVCDNFKKAGLSLKELHEVEHQRFIPIDGTKISLAWAHVNHSIPQSAALLFECEGQRIIHSGDYRAPREDDFEARTDLDFLTQAPVRALFLDSTSSTSNTESIGEAEITDEIVDAIGACPGRVFATTFSSQMQRLDTLSRVAEICGRKLWVHGHQFRKHVQRVLKYLPLDEAARKRWESIEVERHFREASSQSIIVLSGSQGEPTAALARAVRGEFHGFTWRNNDVLVYASRVIPGNELSLHRLFDQLAELGVRVLRSSRFHTSGHGDTLQLSEAVDLIKPESVVPIHGAPSQLTSLKTATESLGSELVLIQNGDRIDFRESTTIQTSPIDVVYPSLEAGFIREDPIAHIRDRSRLGRAGVLVIQQHESKVSCISRALRPNVEVMIQECADMLEEHLARDRDADLEALALHFFKKRARYHTPVIIATRG